MGKAAKMTLRVLSAVLLPTVVLATGLGLHQVYRSSGSKETLGKADTEFKADETGERIANIPFARYISEGQAPQDAVIAELLVSNTGEQNSAVLQALLDTASQNGGGTVCVPVGEYKISTVALKSNTTLFIPYGARLTAVTYAENSTSQTPLRGAVLLAEDAENIRVTGGGTVNGAGLTYTDEPKETQPLYALQEFNLYTRVIEARKRIRPAKEGAARNKTIWFKNCTNVVLQNLVLEEAAEWTCVLEACSGVSVSQLVIDNPMHIANTDGIDVVGSEDVTIENCFIATGDDSIVLKSPNQAIRNVQVRDCILASFANCFKIGTETQFDVEEVTVENCRFFLPDGIVGGYAGISVESADGANIRNVSISNIEMDGVSAPILIWLGDRLRYERQTVGSIQNVRIENVNAINTELPSAVTGCKHEGTVYAVQDVTLSNVRAVYRDTSERLTVRQKLPESAMQGYPEITRVSHIYMISHELSAYWSLPCYGILVRYTQNTQITDYNAVARSCNTLPFAYEQENI